MFNFNHAKFDFWEIYDSIKRFYPIGIKKDDGKLFYAYPGLKELEALLIDNIHDEAHLKDRWLNFTQEIEILLKKPVIGTTYGQAPSFSAYLELDKTVINDITRTKELHFFVSLVGKFYSIIGQENTLVEAGNKKFRTTLYLVISPETEYAEYFSLLSKQIEDRFENYRFVPFEICTQRVNGLNVFYSDENLDTVFTALFNNQVDLRAKTLGNDYHKYEDWIKDGYIDTGERWTAYPPSQF